MPGSFTAEDVDQLVVSEERPEAGVGLMEQLWAATNVDNSVVNVARAMGLTPDSQEPMDAFDPNFDAYQHLTEEEKPIGADFAEANSVADLDKIRAQRRMEADWSRTVQEGPLNPYVATILAGLADPTNYVGGSLIKGASKVATLARGAALGGGIAAAQEAVLQTTQRTRTANQSIAAVLGSSLFGGAISIPVALRQGPGKATEKALVDELTQGLDEANMPQPGVDAGNLGAARPDPVSILEGQKRFFDNPDNTKLLSRTGGLGAKVGTLFGKVAGDEGYLRSAADVAGAVGRAVLPVSEILMTSTVNTSRKWAMMLTDVGLLTKGHLAGQAAPAPLELRVRGWDKAHSSTIQALNQAYRAYRTKLGKGQQVMSRQEFFAAVGNAQIDQFHPNQVAREAAQWVTDKVFKPILKEYKAAGLMPKDISDKAAQEYFTRVWKWDEINRRRPEFKQIVVDWLDREMNLTAKGNRKKNQTSRGELEGTADNLIEQMMTTPAGRTSVGIKIKGTALHDRTFHIENKLVRDFIETNMSEVAHRYIKSAAQDIESARLFGADDLDPIAKITKEFDQELTELLEDPKLTEAGRARIAAQVARERDLVIGLSDRLRGKDASLSQPGLEGLRRLGAGVRTWNYVTSLGLMTVSAVTDVAMPILRHGMTRTIGPIMVDAMRGFKAVRGSKKELQLASGGLEWFLSQRAASMFEVGEHFTNKSRIEQALDAGGRMFGIASGMVPWNIGAKSVSSLIATTRILEAAEKVGKAVEAGAPDPMAVLSRSDRLAAARTGFNAQVLARIAKQAEHWERLPEGTIRANSEAWTDKEVLGVFREGLLATVDDTILTPFRGDRPLWTGTHWGMTLSQFMSFAWAAHQRILGRAAQTHDMATASGLIALSMFAGMQQVFRDLYSDGEVRERTAGQWAINIIDRSGMLTLPFYADTALHKLTRGYSLQGLVAGQEASRFQDRDVVSQLLGPSFGAAWNASSAIGNALSGEFTASDLHRMRRLLPFQNLIGLGKVFDWMESALVEWLDLPEYNKGKKAGAR